MPSAAARPVDLFDGCRHEPGVVWLDSSLTGDVWGRYSLLARRPVSRLTLPAGASPSQCASFWSDLDRLTKDTKHLAAGFISYEACLPWLRVTALNGTPDVPLAEFLVYDHWLVYDHSTESYQEPNLAEAWTNAQSSDPGGQTGKLIEAVGVACDTSRDSYLATVKRIKHHIREGDIYQANYTCRFRVASPQPPEVTYSRLRDLNPAPYGAWMNFGEYQVLSSSPERMFLKTGRTVQSTPIKGTIARGSGDTTAINEQKLRDSVKDRAELLMIVDLVRNDLGKIAEIGSVQVDSLFRTQAYANLIHLMSDISATLRPEVRLTDVLASLLPGGSITGAPKKRAVEIIGECETVPRSVYTGCIGYVHGDRADFNIAIRTMVHHLGEYHLHAGGGIVADSQPEAEYDEMMLKARNLFRAVGVQP